MFGKRSFWEGDTSCQFRKIGRVLADFDAVIAEAEAYAEDQRKDISVNTRTVLPQHKLGPEDAAKPQMQQTLFNRILTVETFTLYRLVEFLGIDGLGRINKQMPGQAFVFHVDNLKGAKYLQPDVDPSQLIRVQCALTPRVWGHIYKFGDVQWEWEVGDVVWFDWQNSAHGTANIDETPRYTYQITGIMTDRTRQLLEDTKTQPFTLDLRK